MAIRTTGMQPQCSELSNQRALSRLVSRAARALREDVSDHPTGVSTWLGQIRCA